MPAAPVRPCGAALQLVPKLICVGFCAGCGMAERGDGGGMSNFLPRDFPVSSFGCLFLFLALVVRLRGHRISQSASTRD